jgi:hypothetical protein
LVGEGNELAAGVELMNPTVLKSQRIAVVDVFDNLSVEIEWLTGRVNGAAA